VEALEEMHQREEEIAGVVQGREMQREQHELAMDDLAREEEEDVDNSEDEDYKYDTDNEGDEWDLCTTRKSSRKTKEKSYSQRASNRSYSSIIKVTSRDRGPLVTTMEQAISGISSIDQTRISHRYEDKCSEYNFFMDVMGN
jgi:hypothetical protein